MRWQSSLLPDKQEEEEESPKEDQVVEEEEKPEEKQEEEKKSDSEDYQRVDCFQSLWVASVFDISPGSGCQEGSGGCRRNTDKPSQGVPVLLDCRGLRRCCFCRRCTSNLDLTWKAQDSSARRAAKRQDILLP